MPKTDRARHEFLFLRTRLEVAEMLIARLLAKGETTGAMLDEVIEQHSVIMDQAPEADRGAIAQAQLGAHNIYARLMKNGHAGTKTH